MDKTLKMQSLELQMGRKLVLELAHTVSDLINKYFELGDKKGSAISLFSDFCSAFHKADGREDNLVEFERLYQMAYLTLSPDKRPKTMSDLRERFRTQTYSVFKFFKTSLDGTYLSDRQVFAGLFSLCCIDTNKLSYDMKNFISVLCKFFYELFAIRNKLEGYTDIMVDGIILTGNDLFNIVDKVKLDFDSRAELFWYGNTVYSPEPTVIKTGKVYTAEVIFPDDKLLDPNRELGVSPFIDVLNSAFRSGNSTNIMSKDSVDDSDEDETDKNVNTK